MKRDKKVKDLLDDLKDGIEITGTVEKFGFDGYYETDTPETPIEVHITLDDDGCLRAHCESNCVLYSEELGGNILDFLQEYGSYSAEVIEEAREQIDQ